MILGLCGLARSGKSTIAAHLEARGFYRLRFSSPLKNMLRAIGLTESEIEGDLKESPCDALGGATPRHAMLTLGTEWGRDMIHPDLWVILWQRHAAQHSENIVVEDMRFPNELAAIRNLGGIVWRVDRGAGRSINHRSEGFVRSFEPDRIIMNDGDPDALYDAVDVALSEGLGG